MDCMGWIGSTCLAQELEVSSCSLILITTIKLQLEEGNHVFCCTALHQNQTYLHALQVLGRGGCQRQDSEPAVVADALLEVDQLLDGLARGALPAPAPGPIMYSMGLNNI